MVPESTQPAPLAPAWRGLVDDAAALAPEASIHDASAEHHRRRSEQYADLVGCFAVRDTDLPLLRGASAGLAVVVTGGAGQLAGAAGLGQRLGLPIDRISIALRDLDDPVGNARRVVAAVDAALAEGVLDEDTPVYVEIPHLVAEPTWLAAADEVAAVELRLQLRTGGPHPEDAPSPDVLAGLIDAALDREAPFRCTTGLEHAVSSSAGLGFLNVLAATRLAFDGSPREEVVAVLAQQDADALCTMATDLDLAGARRWLTSFDAAEVGVPLAELRTLGLLAPA